MKLFFVILLLKLISSESKLQRWQRLIFLSPRILARESKKLFGSSSGIIPKHSLSLKEKIGLFSDFMKAIGEAGPALPVAFGGIVLSMTSSSLEQKIQNANALVLKDIEATSSSLEQQSSSLEQQIRNANALVLKDIEAITKNIDRLEKIVENHITNAHR